MEKLFTDLFRSCQDAATSVAFASDGESSNELADLNKCIRHLERAVIQARMIKSIKTIQNGDFSHVQDAIALS